MNPRTPDELARLGLYLADEPEQGWVESDPSPWTAAVEPDAETDLTDHAPRRARRRQWRAERVA